MLDNKVISRNSTLYKIYWVNVSKKIFYLVWEMIHLINVNIYHRREIVIHHLVSFRLTTILVLDFYRSKKNIQRALVLEE